MRLIGHASRPPGKALIVFIAGLFSLLAVASDLYLPALPALRRDLGASDAQAQLTLSALVVGFGVAQLAYGPFSDRFGRRPVLLAGLAVFILASIAAMLAPTIETLVGARFLQGVGACSGQVIGRAIVRDVYEPVRGARTLAQIFLVLGLAPLFGPLLGGYLAVWFGWRATFAFLVLCGIAVCGGELAASGRDEPESRSVGHRSRDARGERAADRHQRHVRRLCRVLHVHLLRPLCVPVRRAVRADRGAGRAARSASGCGS